MTPQPAEFVRKLPTQARAQHTVNAILRATAHILKTKGYAECSTNAVAKKAGVSIGSLYQYFPSKEALITALAEEHAQKARDLMLESIAAAAAQPRSVEEMVRAYIAAMVRLHADDPELHRVLMEQLPGIRVGVLAMQRASNQTAGLVRAWLEAHRSQLREVDVEVATYVLITSVEAVTHLRLMDRPAQLDTETLVDELSELVLRYLGIAPTKKPHRRRG
ncbi:MAG: TetR family transcriptional regulator [Archangium sp.]|nr:TetR family transcriptional regulator [Archangium sp.]